MSTNWITSGSIFWVTKFLQKEGRPLTTHAIWRAVEESKMTREIPSKTHLKRKVLNPMLRMGNLERAQADDIQKKYRNGWTIVPENAFKYIHPDLRE